MVEGENILVRKYLLGAFGEHEQQRIEEKYFTDSLFLQEVEIVEDELIEDYMRDTLSPEERDLFVRHCLPIPRYSNKLEVARAMQTYAQQTTLSAVQTASPSSPNVVAHPSLWFRSAGWKYCLWAAVLLVCLAGVWLLIRDAQRKSELLKAQERRAVLEQALAKLNLEDEAGQNSEVASTTYTVKLLPFQLREDGGTATLNLAAGVSVIKFQLSLPAEGGQNLSIVFLSDRDEELFTIKNIPAQQIDGERRLDVRVPKEVLKPGNDYQISVRQIDSSQNPYEVANYYFRVSNV